MLGYIRKEVEKKTKLNSAVGKLVVPVLRIFDKRIPCLTYKGDLPRLHGVKHKISCVNLININLAGVIFPLKASN